MRVCIAVSSGDPGKVAVLGRMAKLMTGQKAATVMVADPVARSMHVTPSSFPQNSDGVLSSELLLSKGDRGCKEINFGSY